MYIDYLNLIKECPENIILAGRSAEMKYLDMSPTIERAFEVYNEIKDKLDLKGEHIW